MASSSPSLEDYYELFQSHLLGDVLGLPGSSPPVRALISGAGIELLNDFLLQPPTYYQSELTYIEVDPDGSITRKGLHATYVDLLMAFYWWCQSYMEGQRIPSYLEWARTTRADFLHFLENDFWTTGEVPQFTFPIVGVLPGTVLKVLQSPAVPVQDSPSMILGLCPRDEEQGSTSQECLPQALPVTRLLWTLLASVPVVLWHLRNGPLWI